MKSNRIEIRIPYAPDPPRTAITTPKRRAGTGRDGNSGAASRHWGYGEAVAPHANIDLPIHDSWALGARGALLFSRSDNFTVSVAHHAKVYGPGYRNP